MMIANTPTATATELQNAVERKEESRTSFRVSPVLVGLSNYLHLRDSRDRTVRKRNTAAMLRK